MSGKSRSEWISVDKALPPEHVLIWFYSKAQNRVCFGHRRGACYYDAEQGDEFDSDDITATMAFEWPAPPEAAP